MFELLLALGLSALPAGGLLFYFYRRDKARPEPLGLVGKSVLFGFLAVAPAAGIEILLGSVFPPLRGLPGALVEAFLVAGLVEESVKLFFVKRYLFRRPEFDERADGIVYAICVSLGFAFVEDFLYGYADLGVLLLRAFTAVPLHAVASGVMGYYVGIEKIEGRRAASALAASHSTANARDAVGFAAAGGQAGGAAPLTEAPGGEDSAPLAQASGGEGAAGGPGERPAATTVVRPWAAKASRRGLAWAVLIHGLYDFFLLTRSLAGLLVLPLLVVGWRVLSKLYRRALAEDDRDARLPAYQSHAAPIL